LDFSVVALAVVLYGAGNGIGSIARGTVPLALFGPERYAILMGRLALPLLVAMAVAPLIGGLAFQKGGAEWTLSLLLMMASVRWADTTHRLPADAAGDRRWAVAIVSLRALPSFASSVRIGAAWQVGGALLSQIGPLPPPRFAEAHP
jgi:hypothetical protein